MEIPSISDYTTISRRINRLDIRIKDTDNKNNEFKDEYFTVAIDSTDIKVTNSGQWMQDKWHIKNKTDIWRYIYSVNVKTKKILSMKGTNDEHVHDSKVLPELVKDMIKRRKKITISELYADDGDYEGYEIFRCLK
jgi:hypothetical protein